MLIGNRYELIQAIEGGMGVACICRDRLANDRRVVLKTYKDDCASQTFRASLVKEASAWIALHGHEYLAEIEEICSVDGRIYLKMPFYRNGSLGDLIERRALSLEQAVNLAAQLLLGMRYVSDEMQMLHLDLKPQNVLIGDAGEALITDLGLAKPYHRELLPGVMGAGNFSESSGISGTIPYIAPEIFEGSKPSPGADIWAWGLIFFEMLTGRRAFSGESPAAIVERICSAAPNGWGEFSKTFPQPIVEVVAVAIEKNPSARFRTFTQLAERFDTLLKTGFGDHKYGFWRRDTRVSLNDIKTVAHWMRCVRPKSSDVRVRFVSKETECLTRAARYRVIGNRESALQCLRELLGSDGEWGSTWDSLMESRTSGSLHVERSGLEFTVLLGRDALASAAELRWMVFLDGLYSGARLYHGEVDLYRQVAYKFMGSKYLSPKLMELCGQFFLRTGDLMLAEALLEKAWKLGDWGNHASTAACLATLFGEKGDFEKLRHFAVSEIERRFAEIDDAVAQEACARPYLYLRDADRALHYLKRSLSLDIGNPWGIMQACISAWNLGRKDEAVYWRCTLSSIAPNSTFEKQLDDLIPSLSQVRSQV